MNRAEFDQYLLYGAGLCIILGIANLVLTRQGKRGPMLAYACFILSGTLVTYHMHWPAAVTISLSACVVFALLGDGISRASKKAKE